ncbi:hypothetical protein O3P69_005735 [Scylla paramamosain]|uniref:Uncharacterized protein n=1 Tax=Scylla paramamosain TaxID=85552 RepID=A0AAW0U987_SCYPA
MVGKNKDVLQDLHQHSIAQTTVIELRHLRVHQSHHLHQTASPSILTVPCLLLLSLPSAISRSFLTSSHLQVVPPTFLSRAAHYRTALATLLLKRPYPMTCHASPISAYCGALEEVQQEYQGQRRRKEGKGQGSTAMEAEGGKEGTRSWADGSGGERRKSEKGE